MQHPSHPPLLDNFYKILERITNHKVTCYEFHFNLLSRPPRNPRHPLQHPFLQRPQLSYTDTRSNSRKQRLETAVGNRCADHVTPLYPQKLALTSPTGGGRSVGIVRSRTKATEF